MFGCQQLSPASSAVSAGPSAARAGAYAPPPIRGRSSRSFGLVFAGTAVLLAIAWPVVTYFGLNHFGADDVGFIEALYERKTISMERQQTSGRLVIVAGSSGLFGIDCDLMEHELHRPVVNFATHAGLGAHYLLDRAKRSLKPGDQVLLSPEYELSVQQAEGFNAVSWNYVVTYDKSFIFRDGWPGGIQALYSQPTSEYLQSWTGWRLRAKGRVFSARGNYDVSAMDEEGDLRRPVPSSIRAEQWDLPFPNPQDPNSSVRWFLEFADWAKARNIRIFYAWPPRATPDGTLAPQSRQAPKAVEDMLRQMSDVLDTPADDAYPAAWFTDTVYHANGGCRRVRTERLIRALKQRSTAVQPPPVEPSAIYLVSSGAGHSPWPPRTFDEEPGTQARYLVTGANSRSDAVNSEQALALHDRGLPIWFDDDAVMSQLPQGEWSSEVVAQQEISLAGWMKRYARCLFVIARPQQTVAPAFPAEVPTGPVLMFAYPPFTHPLAIVRRHFAGYNTDLSSITHSSGPDLLIALSKHSTERRLEIEVNHFARAAAGDGETAVVVIDTQLGVVLDSATFDAEGRATQSALRRLVRRAR